MRSWSRRAYPIVGITMMLPLATLCAESPRAASQTQTSWVTEEKVGRFVLHADFDLGDTRELIRELEQLSGAVQQLVRLQDSSQPIHLVLFASEPEYRRYMAKYFPRLPSRRALFIRDRGPGMLFTHLSSDTSVDLRHEVTHALLSGETRSLPLWLDEGLAEYFEVAPAQRFGRTDYLKAIIKRDWAAPKLTVARLEQFTLLPQFTPEHYLESWAWVHYLMHRNQQTRQLLTQYLRDHQMGRQPPPLSRQLRLLTTVTEQDIKSHFTEVAYQQGTQPKSLD